MNTYRFKNEDHTTTVHNASDLSDAKRQLKDVTGLCQYDSVKRCLCTLEYTETYRALPISPFFDD